MGFGKYKDVEFDNKEVDMGFYYVDDYPEKILNNKYRRHKNKN